MAEENEVIVKQIETKKIPIDKIKTSNLQVRVTNVTKGLEVFAEQIRKVGLIQPVVVYKKDDYYELLAGQRRYLAHKDILKWQEILAMIIEEPKSHMMKKTISWLENEARAKMSNKDKLKWIAEMYSEKITISDIAKTLGVSQDEVKSAINLPRVPDVVREAVQKGEIDPVTAVRATDAKRFEKGVTPEKDGGVVLDLAKKMMQNNVTKNQMENMIEYAENNPEADTKELLSEGIKNVREKLSLELLVNDAKRLERYAKSQEKTKAEAAIDLVIEGLDDHGE
jgi:ParB family chromosome partitioning protein